MSGNLVAKRIRLLPAVMVVVAAALALKGLDLVQDARAASGAAETATAAAQNATPDHKDAAADPADEDATDSAAEVDVLSSLSRRRSELDARDKALDMRAHLLTAAEQRVDAKIADLKSLEGQIRTLLGKRDEAEKRQVTALVKVYSAMKPRDAARIFNTLDEAVLLDVARQMKPDSLAAIMAAMNPQQAQDLTVKLANRVKLPGKPDLPSAAQLAATAPPPAQPTPAASAATPPGGG